MPNESCLEFVVLQGLPDLQKQMISLDVGPKDIGARTQATGSCAMWKENAQFCSGLLPGRVHCLWDSRHLVLFRAESRILGRGMFLHVSSKAAKFARCCRFVRNFSLMRLPRVQKPPSRLVFRHLSRTSFCLFSVGKVQGCPILCMTLQCRLDLQSVQ